MYPTLPAVGLGLLAGGLLGLCLDLTILRPVYRLRGEARVLLSLLLTLGVSFIIDGFLNWRYPLESLTLRIAGGPVEILGVPMRRGSLVASAITLLTFAGLFVFFRYTSLGRAVRSVIQEPEGARLVGIYPDRILRLILVLSGVLAALVAVTRSMVTPVDTTSGLSITVFALIITVVGGLGSVAGAFLAGIILGIVSVVAADLIGTSYLADHPPRSSRGDHLAPPRRVVGSQGMSCIRNRTPQLTGATGTAQIGGAEARASRSLTLLLVPIAVVGAALALVPLWIGGSRVLMGVAVLGLAYACYTIAFNVIFGSTGQLFLCVGALAGIGGYGGAILADTVGLPIIVSILVATLAAALIGGPAQLRRGTTLPWGHLYRNHHSDLFAGFRRTGAWARRA